MTVQVARMGETRNTYTILVGQLQRKRLLAISECIWEVNGS